MITATISETKNRLSELLRKVKGGEILVILDRDRPVARVEAMSEEEFNPNVVPAKQPERLQECLSLPIAGAGGRASGTLAALLEERASGW